MPMVELTGKEIVFCWSPLKTLLSIHFEPVSSLEFDIIVPFGPKCLPPALA